MLLIFTLVFGLPIDLALKASFLILKAKKAKLLQVIGAFFAVELIETTRGRFSLIISLISCFSWNEGNDIKLN